MDLFDENVELWKREWPLKGFKLEQLVEDRAETPSVSSIDFSPVLEDVKTLFVYGIGSGEGYEKIREWLAQDTERRALWLEEDPHRIAAFFRTSQAKALLEDPQAVLYWIEEDELDGALMETLYWQAPMLSFSVIKHPSKPADRFEALKYQIQYGMIKKNSLVTEYLQFGVPFFRNFYLNLLMWPQSLWGNKLFGAFSNTPAIICGAGPSLNKQLPLLSTLQDKALIFAGGSSLNAVSKASILPHFGAGIDPNSTQAVRLKETSALNIPFFYRMRIFPEALKLVQGPKLYISGAGGYDIAEWFEEKLGIESDFLDEGYNVVNFCTEIAVRMGCNPILYIGMDLAFTDKKSYADGVVEAPPEEEGTLVRRDIYGRVTTTSWKWVAESDWLKEFKQQHPDFTFINATEGGIGFEGVDNIPLKEVAASYLQNPLHLKSKVEKALENCKAEVLDSFKVEEALQEMKESLVRSIEIIDKMDAEVEKELGKPEPEEKASSTEALLLEYDLQKEPAYEYILDIFHHVFARCLSRESTRLRLNKTDALTERMIHVEKLKIQQKKLKFLRDVAEANRLLIEFAETSMP